MSQPHPPRNPADLLGLGATPALCRLLRACGTDEALITGGASDYDKFLALAAAMPLCDGHPLRDEVNRTLTNATGLAVPLCPHTAVAHWEAWVERHWYGRQDATASSAVSCGCCAPSEPVVWREEDLTRLPAPTAVQASDLTTWSQMLESALPTDGAPALLRIPDGYAFIRPNPYHANLAVGKVFRGEEPSKAEGDLLVTQALRVWGLALNRMQKTDAPLLLLRGGDPAAVTALCAYLAASKALPAMAWLPDDPAHAEALCGLYGGVGTGYTLTEADTPDTASADTAGEKRGEYAKVAPVGKAVVVVRRG